MHAVVSFLRKVRWIVLVFAFLGFGVWHSASQEVLAQVADGNLTLVKEAVPADGTDFVIKTPLLPINAFGSEGSDADHFAEPVRVAVGANGSLYILDPGHHRIAQYDATDSFVRAWGWGVATGADALETCTTTCHAGKNGDGAGQLEDPFGLAVGGDGSVYVADYSNHRIQQFDAEGEFIRAWGWGVDTGADALETCTTTCQQGIAGGGVGQLNFPADVAVGADGSIYVADYVNERIQQFDAEGRFIRMWGWGVDTGADAFEICTTTCQAGSQGNGAGQFFLAAGLTVGADGSVYVADSLNSRVQQFDAEGEFIRAWGWGVDTGADAFEICTTTCQQGIAGGGAGQFSDIYGITVGVDGSVYVADYSNERVQQFDSEGNFVQAWGWGVATDADAFEICTTTCQTGKNGSGAGQFFGPLGMTMRPDGTFYVADSSNVRVQRFLGGIAILDDAAIDDGDAYTDTLALTGLPPGSYTFTETLPTLWTLDDVTCTGDEQDHEGNVFTVALSAGAHITCTLTNLTQSVTVEKVVTGGGPLTVDDFTLFVDGSPVTRSVPTLLETGLHTVTETGDPRYAATFGGACDASGIVMLGIGSAMTCTITNTYIPQSLTVEKIVVGGGPLTADDFALFVDGNPITRGVATLLGTGLHTVTETSAPNYAATFGGACDASGSVTLNIGEHLTCTITNTRLTGELVVAKDTVPDDATANWLFDVDGPTAYQETIRGDERVTTTVATGSYTITESAGAETDLDEYTTSYACVTVGGSDGPSGDGTTATDVNVGAGATVVCTFTNERLPASIVVTKSVGTDPNSCATTSEIEVTASSTVYFCITVENTGQLTLTTHLVEDPLLGISESIEQELAPNGTLALTHNQIGALAVVATSDITNTVTVTSLRLGEGVSPEAEPVTATDEGSAVVDVTMPTHSDPTNEPGYPYRLHLPLIGE